MIGHGCSHQTVEDTCPNPPTSRLTHTLHSFEKAVHRQTRLGRKQHERSIGEEKQVIAKSIQHLAQPLLVLRALLDEIPLVDHHDARLPRLLYLPPNPLVLTADALGCINHQHAKIRALKTLFRAHNGKHLHRVRPFRLWSDPRCINQSVKLVAAPVGDIDRIPGSSRNRRHERTLILENSVGERRFAHIWPSKNSNLQRFPRADLTGNIIPRQKGINPIHQHPNAQTVFSTNGHHRAESKPREFRRQRHVLVMVDLVDDQNERLGNLAH